MAKKRRKTSNKNGSASNRSSRPSSADVRRYQAAKRKKKKRQKQNVFALVMIFVALVILSVIIVWGGRIAATKIKEVVNESEKITDLEAGQQAIFLKKDGSLVSEVCESFSSKNYKFDALESSVSEEIQEFNSKYGSTNDAAKVDLLSLVNEDKEVVLQVSYKTVEDYLNYWDNYIDPLKTMVLTCGLASEADQAEGELSLKDASGASLSFEDAKAQDGVYFLATDQVMIIKLEGELVAVSDTAKIADDGTVTTSSGSTTYLFYKN